MDVAKEALRGYLMKSIIFVMVLGMLACHAIPTGVHRSVSYQNLKEVQDYVEGGGNINAVDQRGSTPLVTAAYYGSAPITLYLCEKGADSNVRDVEGKTALIHAAYYGHITITNILLKSGADPNITDNYGYNALDYAEKYSREEIVILLKSYGARRFSDK